MSCWKSAMSIELQQRAECPEKFYKYRSMDDRSAIWVERTICNQEIYFAPATTFNDPFDLRPLFSLDAPKKVQRSDYERLSKKFEPHLSRKERRAEVGRVMSGPMRKENVGKVVDEIQQIFTNIITTTVGVLCVSTKRDDILMWSHYGDSHRGVCLEFDGSFAFMAHAQEVRYAKERRPINAYEDDYDTMIRKALLTKSDHWCYEAEWRLIRSEKGPGVVEFRPPNLTGVIIGAHASPGSVEKIEKWVSQSTSPIKIYRASANRRTFNLDIKP